MTDQNSNPFFSLFGSTSDGVSTSDNNENSAVKIPQQIPTDVIPEVTLSDEINQIAEEVFSISLARNNNSVKSGRLSSLVFLNDVASIVQDKSYTDLKILKIAIFERILLPDPEKHLIVGKNANVGAHVIESKCVIYLYECYKILKAKLQSGDCKKDIVDQIIRFVLDNVITAIRQPELFENQDTHEQVVTLFEYEQLSIDVLNSFMKDITDVVLAEEGKSVLHDALRPVLVLVHRSFANTTVMTFPRSRFTLLNSFVSIPTLAELVIDYCKPAQANLGVGYADTLLGAMMNLSCLPKSIEGAVEYFEKPLDDALSALEGNLWTAMSDLCERIHGLLEKILRTSPELRCKVLAWLGGCLDANIPRGRIWATSSLGFPAAIGFISDGFAINLASVLLRLSQPFVKNQLFLKIDPTYSAVRVQSPEEMDKHGVHCRSLVNETCLQPVEEGESRPFSNQPYSFITECFHMTHRAIDLSIRVLLEKTQQLSQEIGRLQHTMLDVPGFNPWERMELEMSRFLCMRCALLEPSLLKLLGKFEVATATWLIQVILDPNREPRENYSPAVMRELHFPLSEDSPPTLRCVPELIPESIGRFMKLAETYSPQTLEEGGLALMEPLMSVLLVLMGSKQRARNPHLRAHLAQCLACLLPRDQDQPSLNPNPLGVFYREKLFVEHPHKDQIVGCLLMVFVSIEMTSEGVPFEQRFNYRRPMYTVMDYLWSLPYHRGVFKQLAAEAEANMDEVTPPLFLRFLNLLMNDAIFLLDEALSNMSQIRTLQAARDNGQSLPADERDRNEQLLRQIGMTARFDNILGRETIHTLEYMSSEIKTILCHQTMVDRIAAMLNYFLYHLVGPKKKNLKVKDRNDEYKFDPAAIVKDICRIYVHLGSCSDFCAAVSRDGRSYSPQLFSLAQDVLARIGGADLMGELETVAEEVARLAAVQQTDEELLAEAPEEFLDPIMSTLMSDPVILPSSRINIDRATIARHLLSDQTDPFNREPLTMNLVKSNTELKQRIEAWVSEKRLKSNKAESSA
uniref:Ubiquitin conjugation factor E4 A n=1 Tax=Lygus hesperus TaxID=30085 RepID=A0A146L1T6_LYGHE